MKNWVIFFCFFFSVSQASAQPGDKKDIFTFPITAYTMNAGDSIIIVQVEMPLSTNAVIEKEALGLMRHNYSNNKEDTAAIGYGRCHLIKANYYYFSIRLYNRSIKPQKDDLLYVQFNYPVNFKGRIYGLVKNAVYFEQVTGGKFYDLITPSSLNEQQENRLIDSLVTDIKYTGQEMIKQNNGQDQDVKGGMFDGKKLFAAMQTVTATQVKDFIDYVLARPVKHAGNTWKISETFATWMVSSTPTVVKQ
jgi:hypothetical protein